MSKKIFLVLLCQCYSSFGFLSKVPKSARVVRTWHRFEWCSFGPVYANGE